jgi:YidC/Oxa1 family membrane protein insertase
LSWALLIPILAGLTQWLSAKLMENKKKPTIGGPAQEQPGANSMKVMNTIMPIISAVFCVSFPACMGLYWIASSVVQIVIQIFINKSMDGIEVDQIVKMNIEKTNAKRAKKGLPPLKISNVTSNYVEQVKKMEAREARKDEREAEIKKSTSYYNASGKPASLKDKANMVKMFNERNNNNNK